jgi:cytokinin dehydrogenase
VDLITDARLLADAVGDFGNLIRRRPVAAARPDRVEALMSLVRRARGSGTPLAVRGQGHSVFGQSQVAGGWLVDMGALAEVAVGDGCAIVGGGACWRDVVRATVARGLAPPVLTDYLGLSVGGTLSVGGFGGASFAFGTQADQVLELTMVTGTGDLVVCSEEQEAELFSAARAGLGQVGVIASAKIRLVAAPTHVRHYRALYGALDEALHDLDRAADEARFDQVSAVGLVDREGRWSFHIDAVAGFVHGREPDDRALLSALPGRGDVVTTDAPYLDHALRLDEPIASWHTSGLWRAPHPWIDVLLPDVALPSFARSIVTSTSPDDLGVDGAMLLVYPASHAQARTPLLPVPRAGARYYLFDVLRCTPGATASRLERLLQENRRIYERALAVGGSLYPISAVRMMPEDWRRHFGAGWAGLAAAKRRYDPDGLLGRGCAIFAAAVEDEGGVAS